uniref:Ubiquitin-activating enzyme SCCH domain-containing protein n=1 Tax=Malurus cyaneus samueli TaxID=2593467 RepID=A0A8C5TL58_9PASS
MDFIVAASNLRAENYDIPPAIVTRWGLRGIIPAIATHAARVGLPAWSSYKLYRPPAPASTNAFLTIGACPSWGFTSPSAAPAQVGGGAGGRCPRDLGVVVGGPHGCRCPQGRGVPWVPR